MNSGVKSNAVEAALAKTFEVIKEQNLIAVKEKCQNNDAARAERMVFLSRLLKERQEALAEENLRAAREAGRLKLRQIQRTQRLAEEMARLKNQEIQERKRREALRASDIELRELDSRLGAAYVGRHALFAIKEREACKKISKLRDNEAATMVDPWRRDDSFEQKTEEEKYRRRLQYREDLRNQMLNNELLRQQKREESHRERKIVEQAGKVLREEDLRLAEEKRQRISHLRAERAAFMEARESWKREEKDRLLDEYNRDSEIIAKKMEDEKRHRESKSTETRTKAAAVEKIARKILAEEMERKEREDVVAAFIEEERNNEIAAKLRTEALKRETVKKELLDDMARQERYILERKARDSAADLAFANELAEQHRIAIKIDQEKNEQRRQKGIQYGKELRGMVEEKRVLYAEGILAEEAMQRLEEEAEERRSREVSVARSDILREHAANLKDLLDDWEYSSWKRTPAKRETRPDLVEN